MELESSRTGPWCTWHSHGTVMAQSWHSHGMWQLCAAFAWLGHLPIVPTTPQIWNERSHKEYWRVTKYAIHVRLFKCVSLPEESWINSMPKSELKNVGTQSEAWKINSFHLVSCHTNYSGTTTVSFSICFYVFLYRPLSFLIFTILEKPRLFHERSSLSLAQISLSHYLVLSVRDTVVSHLEGSWGHCMKLPQMPRHSFSGCETGWDGKWDGNRITKLIQKSHSKVVQASRNSRVSRASAGRQQGVSMASAGFL